MRMLLLLATASTLLIGGCAGGTATPPLSQDHPANANAIEAPLPPPSQTLVVADSTVPPAADPASLMPDMKGMNHGSGGMQHDMKGMQHDHAMPGMKHDVPATQPGENAAPSAPRFTPMTGPATSPAKYTCTMHPEVVSDQPGKCPKCGMKLVPKKQAGESHDHDAKGGHS